MSTTHKFSRQVRNGKVVYVPEMSCTLLKSAHSQPARPLKKIWCSLNALLLAGMTTTVVGLAWLSYQVITDPNVAFWLNQYLPTSSGKQIAAHQPRTLQQILQRLQSQDQETGKPIALATDGNANNRLTATKDILVPIYDANCSKRSCQKIQSLNVYRSLQLPPLLRIFQGKRYYRLLDQITVQGPTEETLVNLARNPRLVTGSTRPMNLSRVEVYNPAPKPGSWLRVTGLRREGNSTSAYGQMLYFHPSKARLVLMLNWASPSGQYPQWQQVTGDQKPELVVKQTVGLEPQFSVYRLQSSSKGSLKLENISLGKPAFANQGYSQSLSLARSGLWSQAKKHLLTVKETQPQRWSANAQAQLDYINLHAAVAQSQVKQTSASRVQTLVARLINGEWNTALKLFQSPETDPADIRALLAADPGRLLVRVDAFLRVNPNDQDAISWGALIRYMQYGPTTAMVWTQQQTGNNKAALHKVKKLLKRLNQLQHALQKAPSITQPLKTVHKVELPHNEPSSDVAPKQVVPRLAPASPPDQIMNPESEAEVQPSNSSRQKPIPTT